MIRVVIADDHHLVRNGIRALLERANDIQVVGEAEDGQEAMELAERLAPDVLIMDIGMPRLDGIQATEQIRARDLRTRVVFLSMHSDVSLLIQALQTDAKGYLLKRSVGGELLQAVRAAGRGETYLTPAIPSSLWAELVIGRRRRGATIPERRLSSREREVLQLIVEGRTNRGIAYELGISVKTVEKHRAHLMSKLGVRDLPTLVSTAIKLKLVLIE